MGFFLLNYSGNLCTLRAVIKRTHSAFYRMEKISSKLRRYHFSLSYLLIYSFHFIRPFYSKHTSLFIFCFWGAYVLHPYICLERNYVLDKDDKYYEMKLVKMVIYLNIFSISPKILLFSWKMTHKRCCVP